MGQNKTAGRSGWQNIKRVGWGIDGGGKKRYIWKVGCEP